MNDDSITINAHSPYIEQYIGVWAILESAADVLRARAAAIDWNAHFARQIEARVPGGSNSGPRPTRYQYDVTPDGIAIINVQGTLQKSESSWGGSTSTVKLRHTIGDAIRNDAVQAIMLRIDSPGGTVSGTEELGGAIAAAAEEKPLAVYADGVMASAAYWIGAQAGTISTNSTGVIGSIGVLAVVYDESAAAAKQGVKVHVVKSADAKGAGVPGTEITPKQLADMQRTIDQMHSVFVDAVASGRGITRDAASKIADARVHVGQQAKDAGLVDHVETFGAAMNRLGQAARKPLQPRRVHAATVNTPPAGALATETSTNEPKAEAAAPDVPAIATGADADQPAGEITPQKEADMSQTETPAPAANANEPKPATLKELRAQFPSDADAMFCMDAHEHGWTLAQATATHSTIQRHVAAKTPATPAAAAPAAQPVGPAPGKKPGVPAVTSAAAETQASDTEGDPVATFNAAVEAAMTKSPNMSRKKAIVAVAKRNPAAHRAFLEATNTKRSQKDLLSDKYD